MSENYADVQQSFQRCLRQRQFLRRFYTLFTGSDERIARKFVGTDWDQQTRLLREGISNAILYAAGTGLGEHEMERLRVTHGARGHDIPDWMYGHWLEALIETLRETDPQWNPRLEARWREAMGAAIERISGRG